MNRQNHTEARHGLSSTESVLGQRSRRLYCEKCRRAVERRHAVHAGRNRSRCPACGELLRPTEKASGQAGNGQEPGV